VRLTPAWTDTRIETLRRGVADGLSASQIAAELGGITRSAVLGKVWRMGIRLTLKQGCKPPRPKAPSRPKQTRRFRGLWPTLHDVGVVPDVEAPELPPNESDFACTIERLTDETCRWPLGEPAHDMNYCGAHKLMPGAYCDRHAALAYKKPERRA
jgi:GcrA cell cycle regulator